MDVSGMNHFTILARDLDETRAFYTEVVGLTEGYRPPLKFPGLWLYAGGTAVLHVIHRQQLPEPGGVFDHMAYSASGLAAAVERLKSRGIDYQLRQQVGTELWQLFFYDPNGARIELDFASDEGPVEGA
jgi:catechol 2,3-dioxygenase-like lactoylglutathione lyase family enzyme